MGLSFTKPENTRRKKQSKLLFDITTKEIIFDDKLSIIIILCDEIEGEKISKSEITIKNATKEKLNDIINKIKDAWYMRIDFTENNSRSIISEPDSESSKKLIVKSILITKVLKDDTQFIEIPIEGYCSKMENRKNINTSKYSACSSIVNIMKEYIGENMDGHLGTSIISSFERIAKEYGNYEFDYNLNEKMSLNKPNNNKNIDINKKIVYNCSTKEIKIYNNIQGIRFSKNQLKQIQKNRNNNKKKN